jgi:hypothetical protein
VSTTLARVAAALSLAASGYLHAELYVHGYRAIPWIGPMFLVQAAGSLAVGVLLLAAGPPVSRPAAGPPVLRLLAAGLAGGALGGFALSRTVGVLGFVEHGLDPAPQALLSLLTELAVLTLLGITPTRHLLARRTSPAR